MSAKFSVYRGVRRVPGISDPQRGRILAVTDDCGRYVINGIPFYDPYGTSQEPDAHYNAIDRVFPASVREYVG